jgi:DNA-binding transcriptional regulator YhcF (GntR family)
MISINLDPNDPRPLVDPMVNAIRRQIDKLCLRLGTRLPSIRKFAKSCGISRFTAVEFYDRLVALGYLKARRGAGFFTTAVREESDRYVPPEVQNRNEELVGHYRKVLTRLHERLGEGRRRDPGIRTHRTAVVRRAGSRDVPAGAFSARRQRTRADKKCFKSRHHDWARGVFRPHLQRSPWMLLNVTACDDPRAYRWPERIAARPKEDWALQATE